MQHISIFVGQNWNNKRNNDGVKLEIEKNVHVREM